MPGPMLLLPLLLAACADPSPPDPGDDPSPATLPLTPPRPVGATALTRGEVVDARAERTDSGWRVDVDLLLHHHRAPAYDGERTWSRAVLVPHDTLALVAPGGRWAPRPLATAPGVPPGMVHVPHTAPRRARLALTFDLPDPLPEDLALRFGDESGVGEVRLSGRLRGADGAPAVALWPVAPSGRPAPGQATAEVDGGERSRSRAFLPILVPPEAGAATLTVEGHAPVAVRWDDHAVDVEVPVTPTGGERERAFANLWSALPAEVPSSIDAHALSLGTPQAVLDFVRDEVAVLGTAGAQRSPEATLRLGAGSPFERALLAQELLARLDVRTVVLCGDLAPRLARDLYRVDLPLPPLPAPLAELMEEARPAAGALADGLEAALADAEAPPGRRAELRLVPEWCWLEQPAGDADDGPTQLDLRPSSLADTPLPFPWRATSHPLADTWRVDVRFVGIVGDEETILGRYASSAPSLSDAAFLFDLHPAGPGRLVPRLSAVDDVEVGGRAGPEVPADRLRLVQLEVWWRDPRDLVSRGQVLELWARGDGPPPEALQVLVTADPTVRDARMLARHLRQAVDGRHPLPASSALRARHDLYSLLRAHLTGGAIPAEPSLLVTAASVDAQGIGWRFETVAPGVPARVGVAPTTADVARAAAADAVARAVVLGVDPPVPPATWLRASADLPRLPRVPPTVQPTVARALEHVWVGASAPAPGEEATIWTLDPASGGIAWYGGVPQATGFDPGPRDDLPADGARWPLARWDLPVRCAEAVRWAGLVGRPAPEGCLPQVATRP